jgi:hypothetical protein
MRDRWLAGLLLILAGCAAPQTGRVPDASVEATASSASVAEFVAGQAARTAALGDFASRGSLEVRWKDDEGTHFEQTQVELAWRERGQRMAFRADKVGERLAWAGADASRWWIFELKREPTRLTTGRRGSVPRDSILPFVGPESVIELMAARPWPDSARASGSENGSRWIEWNLDAPVGAWRATRALVARPGSLPQRVELLDSTGHVIARSTLTRPLSVPVQGLPTGAWPEVAGTMRIQAGDAGATWDIFWDQPGTEAARLKDRLFDLAVLTEALRPQEVVDQDAPSRP